MSVINQVLSDLEERGATALQSDANIRTSSQRQKRYAPGLVAGVLVLGIVAAGLWWNEQKKIPPPPAAPAACGSSSQRSAATGRTACSSSDQRCAACGRPN